MLLDSPAIISILLREPGWQQIQSRIELSPLVAVSAATLLETHMVLTNRIGKDALPIIEAFVQRVDAQIIPFAGSHWRLAAEAFVRFGKGRHKAAFNFADCIVYATAVQTDLPLLYKGNDFSQTDLPLSLPLSKDSA